MNRIAIVLLPLLLLVGCKSDPQPGQFPYPQAGQIPGQVPQLGQVPSQVPGQMPQALPGQVPGQFPVQVPGQVAAMPQALPGQVPGQIPGQVPGQMPVMPQAIPGQPPVGQPAAVPVPTGLGTPPPGLIVPGMPLPPTPGTGATTPEELGKAMAAALNSRNTAALIALFPSQDQLSAVLKCTGTQSPLQEVEKAKKDFANEMYHAWKRNETFAFGGSTAGDSLMTMARGTERKGCVATDDIAIQRHIFDMNVTRNGSMDPGKHRYVLIHIGSVNRWFVVDD